MSSLTGSTISSTYQSLLKIDGNNTLSATLRNITDGVGNITPISMSTTLLNISTAFKLSSYGTGTRTGTATYNLAVDATGNVIEVLGGGGGGQNPTSNYIPLNNGTSNFVDSYIFNDKTNGLLSFTNDYGLSNFGLVCDITNSYYTFGDFTNGGTFSGSQGTANVVGDILVSIDSANKQSIFNDGQNQIIQTTNDNNDIGLKLDFGNIVYSLGDYNGTSNNTYVEVDDANEQITFAANTKLVFQGANLQENAILTYTEKNIKVIAPDGGNYYIPLYN